MLTRFLNKQIPWSQEVFGPGFNHPSIIAHIRSELVEIEKEPHDLEEWIDLIHLGLDGAVRCLGIYIPKHEAIAKIIDMLFFKQRKNFKRKWHKPEGSEFVTHVKEPNE